MGSVFLSHRHAERADAERAIERLGSRWRCLTHAVSPAAAETWQRECRRLIAEADAVVCIVGERTAESPNVEWELETALALGRPLIAMRAQHAAAPRLPGPLAGRAAALVEPDELARRLDEVALERAG